MADYYTTISHMMHIPEEIIDQVFDYACEVLEEHNSEEFCCGLELSKEQDGIWFSTDESVEVEAAAVVIAAIQERFGLREPEVLLWGNGCSKQRLDAFSGGAALIQMDYDTEYIVPNQIIRGILSQRRAEAAS
jgi:hypothetical protein